MRNNCFYTDDTLWFFGMPNPYELPHSISTTSPQTKEELSCVIISKSRFTETLFLA